MNEQRGYIYRVATSHLFIGNGKCQQLLKPKRLSESYEKTLQLLQESKVSMFYKLT